MPPDRGSKVASPGQKDKFGPLQLQAGDVLTMELGKTTLSQSPVSARNVGCLILGQGTNMPFSSKGILDELGVNVLYTSEDRGSDPQIE